MSEPKTPEEWVQWIKKNHTYGGPDMDAVIAEAIQSAQEQTRQEMYEEIARVARDVRRGAIEECIDVASGTTDEYPSMDVHDRLRAFLEKK